MAFNGNLQPGDYNKKDEWSRRTVDKWFRYHVFLAHQLVAIFAVRRRNGHPHGTLPCWNNPAMNCFLRGGGSPQGRGQPQGEGQHLQGRSAHSSSAALIDC